MSESETSMVRPDGGPLSTADGDGDDLVVERASATPTLAPSTTESTAPNVPDLTRGVQGPLSDLQTWFWTVMTHPTSVTAGLEAAQDIQERLHARSAEAILRSTDKMTVADRMEVYHYAYRSRLVGCLVDDFSAVQTALGEDPFEKLCHAYIESHPSQTKTLNDYGRRFPEFLARQDIQHKDFAADLARLEWAIIEQVHAPYGRALDLVGLQSVPQPAWANLRLHPSPTLRVERFDYPVSPYFSEVMRDNKPSIPEARSSATAIYRYNERIWRMELTQATRAILQALMQGETLGAALACLEDPDLAAEAESLETDVMKWFQEWMQYGFFEGFEV